jgi:hypothetical protein
MIVVMIVMLRDACSKLGRVTFKFRLVGAPAPDTEASAGRHRASAGRTGNARLIRLTVRCQFLRRSRIARQPMDGFDRRSDGLGIRLRPAEVPRQSLKKILNLLAFSHLVLLGVGISIGRSWIIYAHINLDCRHCRRICRLTDTESYQCFVIGGNAIAECGAITPESDRLQNNPVLHRTAAVHDKGTVHPAVDTDNKTDPNMQIIVLSLEQWVRSEQSLRWTDIPASRDR